jgi:hypothetical protein
MEQAESDMRNIAATLSEHAMRTFSEADTLLGCQKDLIRAWSLLSK